MGFACSILVSGGEQKKERKKSETKWKKLKQKASRGKKRRKSFSILNTLDKDIEGQSVGNGNIIN